MADRAGIKISDAELNSTMSRLAANNQMTVEGFIEFIEKEFGLKKLKTTRILGSKRLKIV